MVRRPLGPGVNTRVVIGARVIKAGAVDKVSMGMMISMSVVMRNMTETMAGPGVTLISKHKFL